MGRYIKRTVVLAKIEVTQYTDSVPTGGANAVLVSDVEINALDAQNVDRNVILPYLGRLAQLVGPASKKITFTVDLAGSGTAGTVTAWDPLYQACAQTGATAAAPSRWEYNPVSAALKSVTLYIYDDGVQHVFLGCMGDVEFMLGIGERPVMKFSFIGRDGGDTVVSNPAATLTAYRTPLAVTNANSGQINFGGTYSLGAITGGTMYPGAGISSLKMMNQAIFSPQLGGDEIDIVDRMPEGQVELDLTPTQEVSLMAVVKANTLSSMSFVHGTAAGNRALFFMPGVQLTNPKKVDKQGRRLIGFDFRATTVAGNDDVRLIMT